MTLHANHLSTASDPCLATANRARTILRHGSTQMEMWIELPPNYEDICAVFPVVRTIPTIVFCWDHRIYNPNGIDIPLPLLCHEIVHTKQQNGKPDVWWRLYLSSAKFRFEQELAAHRMEYRMSPGPKHSERKGAALRDIAMKLTSPIYGNVVGFAEAMKLIRKG